MPTSSAHSSSQNIRSFHTARFEFPANSSSPLDAKRMPPLGVMAATLVKLIRFGTACFVCFPQMFYFVLVGLLYLLLRQLSVRGQLTLSRAAGH